MGTRLALRALAAAGVLAVLSSCSTMGYLFQASSGQLALINRAKPISEVMRDEKTSPRIRALLEEIGPIKSFGERNGLKPTHNYTDYVKLDRPYAVYVVSACEPLRFQSKEWSFPIVGEFPYLGWFDRDSARSFASDLKKEGLDVDLRGASAYSTLGWFRDAVLSSMLPEGDEALGDLVNVVLHESVHATLYIRGQAYFNESIASFVADRLTVQYLKQTRGDDSREVQAFEKGQIDDKRYTERMHRAYERLKELYDSRQSDSEKLSQKKRILDELAQELKARREINNATLIQFREYNSATPDFDSVLKACGGSMPRLLRYLGKLEPSAFGKTQQDDLGPVLKPLAEAGCPA